MATPSVAMKKNTDPARRPYVFISYRRDDSEAAAGRIFDRLIACFGKANVFRDLDTIAPGVEFAAAIATYIARCDVLITIIGREWLNASDEEGQRRLDDPADFVRAEIREALRLNKYVIPVLVTGVAMPKMATLPPDIVALTERSAIEISGSRFDYDVKRLITAIDPTVVTTTHRSEAPASRFPTLSLLGSLVRVFFTTAMVSIVILVFSKVMLDWTLDGAETSLIVLVVLGIIVALSRVSVSRK